MALVLFFVLFGLTFLDFYDEGYEWDYQSFGTAASGALVLIVNLQVRLFFDPIHVLVLNACTNFVLIFESLWWGYHIIVYNRNFFYRVGN